MRRKGCIGDSNGANNTQCMYGSLKMSLTIMDYYNTLRKIFKQKESQEVCSMALAVANSFLKGLRNERNLTELSSTKGSRGFVQIGQ